MRELALHILDLARNSVEAGATAVELRVVEDEAAGRLEIVVSDNGRGMDEEAQVRATDAFYTSRTTRRWGLGLALFRATCERCDGGTQVRSRPGEGTVVSAWMRLGHVDCPPLGDIGAVVQALACEGDGLRVRYRHEAPGGVFEFDTAELVEELDGVPITEPAVLVWIAKRVNEGVREIGSRL